MLFAYSARKVFDSHDIFAALMGLAKAVQATLGCRNLAGLWDDDMFIGLFWASRHSVPPVPAKKYHTHKRPVETDTKKSRILMI